MSNKLNRARQEIIRLKEKLKQEKDKHHFINDWQNGNIAVGIKIEIPGGGSVLIKRAMCFNITIDPTNKYLEYCLHVRGYPTNLYPI